MRRISARLTIEDVNGEWLWMFYSLQYKYLWFDCWYVPIFQPWHSQIFFFNCFHPRCRSLPVSCPWSPQRTLSLSLNLLVSFTQRLCPHSLFFFSPLPSPVRASNGARRSSPADGIKLEILYNTRYPVCHLLKAFWVISCHWALSLNNVAPLSLEHHGL